MTSEKIIGRNEPCPCGSDKKYKRCCGKDAAPKLGAPMDVSKKFAQAGLPTAGEGAGPANPLAGFDPSQLDPQWMAQFNQAMMRLPRGQLQRMQALMQKAMSGKDISRDAAEFERMMSPEFMNFMKNSPIASMMAQQQAAGGAAEVLPADEGMSMDEARRIVVEAAQKGEISDEQATELLKQQGSGAPKSGKLSQLWKSMTGKK